MLQNGKTLSMNGDAIWKGTYTNNGMLLKIHENSYTIGYSALLAPDGTTASKAKFGNGVFYDASERNNRVYTGAPTGTGAVPVFAGIMVREPAIASGYPVLNDEVSDFQKGMLVKDGYVIYKKGCITGSTTERELSDYVHINWCMFVRTATGVVYFGAKSTDKETSTDILVGRVVEVNPDARSVTVNVSTLLQGDTPDLASGSLTVALTSSGVTTDSFAIKATVGTECVMVTKVALAGSQVVEKRANAVFDEVENTYVANFDFDGLASGQQYTVAVYALTANGQKSATTTVTTN
jgi:hypothetical protein